MVDQKDHLRLSILFRNYFSSLLLNIFHSISGLAAWLILVSRSSSIKFQPVKNPEGLHFNIVFLSSISYKEVKKDCGHNERKRHRQ